MEDLLKSDLYTRDSILYLAENNLALTILLNGIVLPFAWIHGDEKYLEISLGIDFKSK